MDALRLQYKAVSKASRGVRSLFSRAPKPAEVIDRAVRLLRRKHPGRCKLIAGAAGTATAAGTIAIELHPWASPVKLTAPADGELAALITATALGPGYVSHVIEMLDPILEELDFVWAPYEGELSDFAVTRELAPLQRVCTGWLAAQLALILGGEHAKDGKQLGIPQEPRFEIDAAVLTPMGPRSEAWCRAVIADSAAGSASGGDFWPMWETTSAAALSWTRGMWLLWVEVPWRLSVDDAEKLVMKDAHKALAAAYQADKTLAMPWAEWAELVDILDHDDDLTETVRQRGEEAEEPAQRLGYRRHPARFELTSGWSVRLTPRFADAWIEEGAAMAAADGSRSLRCSCVEAEGDTASAMLAKLPMQGDVLVRLDDSAYRGRLEARNDDATGRRLITAIMATDGGAAVISMVVPRGDEAWAIQTWWSLRRAGVEWTAPSDPPALDPAHDTSVLREDDTWRDPWQDANQERWKDKTMYEHWYGKLAPGELPDPSLGPPPGSEAPPASEAPAGAAKGSSDREPS